MEESVVDRLQRLPAVGGLFNNQMRLTDVSGSGNNWAHGFHEYGTQYKDQFLDRVSCCPQQPTCPASPSQD